MKYSQLFGKTRKTVPADAVSVNHLLLLKAGFVDQASSGIFSWLPLGLRVLTKIEQVIREELTDIGAHEVAMPTLISKSYWEKTKRWDVDILYKTKSQTGKEYGLGFSHEEIVAPLAGKYIRSYKDLPLSIFQIQRKFRDELRAKSGVLRGREFGMKDMYSFHKDIDDFHSYYELVKQIYLKIFSKIGLSQIKITEASGGVFTKKHSHEFNVLTQAGETDLLYCSICEFAQNLDITTRKEGNACPACQKGKLMVGKAIEVGNIFDIGTKYAEDFGVSFIDKDGEKKNPHMGCYGIGTTRLVGTIAEIYHDEKGIIWPEEIAPYRVHLISLPGADVHAKSVYEKLQEKGIEVLWDDRKEVFLGGWSFPKKQANRWK
jgi:prolyl-tRNA synthetase